MIKLIVISTFLFSSYIQAMVQNVKFSHGKLKVSGQFSATLGKAFEIKGSSEGKPYRLQILTKKQNKDFYRSTYTLTYNDKTTSGDIMGIYGEAASLESIPTDENSDMDHTYFEIMIKK